jgi:long-chain-fatty-acid--CoA ligase ACSBG
VMMVGDKRKYNVCLVTLKAVGATGELPGGNDLDPHAMTFVSPGVKTISAAQRDEVLIKAISNAITITNKDGKVCPSPAAMIQKFTILPRDFSVQTGELTATLKLKRSVTEEKYLKFIDSMYECKGVYVPFPSTEEGMKSKL